MRERLFGYSYFITSAWEKRRQRDTSRVDIERLRWIHEGLLYGIRNGKDAIPLVCIYGS